MDNFIFVRIVSGRVVTGKEAEVLGLVLKCFATKEEMYAHIDKTVQAIASKSPLTIR